MPQPEPTPPPDDLPIMAGPSDVDQLLKTAEALASEIAAAVGLAEPRTQQPETVDLHAPAPAPMEPVTGHTVIEEAPPSPAARESTKPPPESTPGAAVVPHDAVPAEIAPSATATLSAPPALDVEPSTAQSPVAAEPAPQAEKETIEPEPQPEPAVAEDAPAAPTVRSEAQPPTKVASHEISGVATPQVSFFRRVLHCFMRLARGVALAPILLLAWLAWLIDRPFAKTPARVKNYIGAIALATAITAALSFILPDLLKEDPFAGDPSASESAPE